MLSAACDATLSQEYASTKIWKFNASLAYFYVTQHMAIDADGAPNAYHPNDTGLDALANAGFPGGRWDNVLVKAPRNPASPFIQPDGEYKGYFLSATSLQDRSVRLTEAGRYVDSRLVPYLAFSSTFLGIKGTGNLGDLALVRNLTHDAMSAAIVADIGQVNSPLGEISIRLAENLGGRNVNPRTGTGMPSGAFVYVIFPKTRTKPPWPVTEQWIRRRANQEIATLGRLGPHSRLCFRRHATLKLKTNGTCSHNSVNKFHNVFPRCSNRQVLNFSSRPFMACFTPR